MNTKWTICLVLLPLAFALVYRLQQPHSKQPTDTISAAKDVIQAPVKTTSLKTKKAKADESAINEKLQQLRDELTEMSYTAAHKAESEIVDVYRKNDPKIVAEFKPFFDTWDIGYADRNSVADAVSQYRHSMALLFQQAALNWPLEVGHAANLKGGLEHDKRISKRIFEGLNALHNRVKSVVGEERATELVTKIYPHYRRTSADDD